MFLNNITIYLYLLQIKYHSYKLKHVNIPAGLDNGHYGFELFLLDRHFYYIIYNTVGKCHAYFFYEHI